jgi:NADH:ubiquinone oxidoreductase subunit 2 (subunit N)
MFRSLISVGGWGTALAVVAAVNSVIAFVYYARVVKAAWFDPVPEDVLTGEARSAHVAPTLGLAMGIAAVVVIVTGIFPAILSELGEMTKVFVAGF